MTSVGGVVGATALIAGLVVLLMAALRSFPGIRAAGSTQGLKVIGRVALGPRQGIVLVEIGDRILALSVGEGGVRVLAELERDELPEARVQQAGLLPALPRALANAMRRAAGAAAIAIGLLYAAHPAFAQATGADAPARGNPVLAADSSGRVTAGAVPPRQGVRAARAAAQVMPRADSALARLAPRLDLSLSSGGAGGGLRLSGTVGVVVMLGLLTLLPMLVLLMTSFTRVLIVLQLLRQALGAQNVPPPQVVTAMALLITSFVMAPTLSEANRAALTPWLDGKIEQAQMLSAGVQPFREFMLRETRPSDVQLYLSLADHPPVAEARDIPLPVLMTAFVTSEIRVAFQMGFALFLPFLVIDIVVASVLMSMGMMMLPPTMVSLPFKLLLFVLVDGWNLVVQGLIRSFH